jgi:hypothetical protein
MYPGYELTHSLKMDVHQGVEIDEQKLHALKNLKSRINTRLSALRQTQVAIMIERNLYLSKLRQVENYGRTHHWGNQEEVGKQGQELLQSIHNVLYDASKDL